MPPRSFSIVVVSLAAVFALAACTSSVAQVNGLQRLDDPMPKLSGPTVDGGEITNEMYAGHPLVVNFWASWCAPCRREQPMLNDLYNRYKNQGVQFIGVNSRDQDAAAKAHLKEFGVQYPSLADPDGKVAFDWSISAGLPGTVVVDATGVVRYRKQGEITQAQLEQMLASVVAGPSPGAAVSPA